MIFIENQFVVAFLARVPVSHHVEVRSLNWSLILDTHASNDLVHRGCMEQVRRMRRKVINWIISQSINSVANMAKLLSPPITA